MLNIAICDDDIQITGKIERLLQDIAKRNFVDTEIEVFWNGKSLVCKIIFCINLSILITYILGE